MAQEDTQVSLRIEHPLVEITIATARCFHSVIWPHWGYSTSNWTIQDILSSCRGNICPNRFVIIRRWAEKYRDLLPSCEHSNCDLYQLDMIRLSRLASKMWNQVPETERQALEQLRELVTRNRMVRESDWVYEDPVVQEQRRRERRSGRRGRRE